jgi:hypothetical protein
MKKILLMLGCRRVCDRPALGGARVHQQAVLCVRQATPPDTLHTGSLLALLGNAQATWATHAWHLRLLICAHPSTTVQYSLCMHSHTTAEACSPYDCSVQC